MLVPLVVYIASNMLQCDLEQPASSSDNPKKFTAGLAICLPVRAVLRNLKKDSELYVKVYSDVLKLILVFSFVTANLTTYTRCNIGKPRN